MADLVTDDDKEPQEGVLKPPVEPEPKLVIAPEPTPKPKKPNPWTEDVVQALLDLLQLRNQDEALSFAEVGKRLGRTKGQVVGYTARHFPHFLDKNRQTNHRKAHKPSGATKQAFFKTNISFDAKERKSPAIVRFAEGAPVPAKEPVTPIDPGECAYVFGEPNTKTWAYCGHPILHGSSYCDFHYKATRNPQHQMLTLKTLKLDKPIKAAAK